MRVLFRSLTYSFAALLLVPAASVLAAPGVGEKLPTITADLIDADHPDQPTAFDSSKSKKITTYFIAGTGCPSTQRYSQRFARLVAEYSPKGVDFVVLYPNREDTRAIKLKFQREKQLGAKLVDDQQGKIARSLGAMRTTEVFIANADGTLVYHGAIDDNRDDEKAVTKPYVASALDETLAGKPVTITSSPISA